jgi:hypothetical protein
MQLPDDNENQPEKTTADFIHQDIADSPRDAKALENEEVVIDMPEVSDIPGQEHVHLPSLDAIGDTTASSDDEEGVGLLDDLNEDVETEPADGSEADVSPLEKSLLESADEDMPTNDDRQLKESFLDETDEEGDPINEGSMTTDVSGGDLDNGGVEADAGIEEAGTEDEENQSYSIGGDGKDDPPQDDF